MLLRTRPTRSPRPRRATHPWLTPFQVPGLQLLYDKDLSARWTDSGRTAPGAIGDSIYVPDDCSGNGRHFSQSSSGQRPEIQAGGLDFIFGTPGDILVRTTNLFTATSGLIVAVATLDNPAVTNDCLCQGNTGSNNPLFAVDFTSSSPVMAISQRADTETIDIMFGSTTVTAGVPHLFEWGSTGEANGYSMTLDGVAQTINVISGANTGDWFGDSPNVNNASIGGLKRTGESGFFDGRLALLAVWDPLPSTFYRQPLRNYLRRRFNVTL